LTNQQVVRVFDVSGFPGTRRSDAQLRLVREAGLEPARLAALDPKSVRPPLTIGPDRTKRNEINGFSAIGSGVSGRSDALRCREWTQFGHSDATKPTAPAITVVAQVED